MKIGVPRGSSGFTLVEIISVLVIIAIMSAIVIPKFIDLGGSAKQGIAQGGVNEAKASLTASYAKAYLEAKGGTVLATNIFNQVFPAGNPSGAQFGDVSVTGSLAAATVTLIGYYSGASYTDTWTNQYVIQ